VSQGVDDAMRGVLGTGAQMEDGKQLRCGVDDQPEKDAPVWRNGVGCAARLTAGTGDGGGRRTAHAEFVRARQLGRERLVMVACR
jgi:hypothetical protein